MKVGSRILRGKVEERAQARQQYENAYARREKDLRCWNRNGMMFSQFKLATYFLVNMLKSRITYSERLPFFENGTTEIRLPMVVAPRYIPGNPLDSCEVGDGIEEDTDIVPDASRISPPRLAKGFDPKVGLKIQVELLRCRIRELSCSQHATRTSNSGRNGISVSLSRTDELLNRDFVLRWNLGENKIQTAFHGYKSEARHLLCDVIDHSSTTRKVNQAPDAM